MKLSLAYSTCPNDTFVFEALVHNRIDLQGLQFDPWLSDVEELNRRALRSDFDITKLSYHAWLKVSDQYQILAAGSALGRGNGPLLVSLPETDVHLLKREPVAIPGELTTANLLLSLAYPEIGNKRSFLFSDIETAILDHQVIAGVLIHENRFTYQERGLHLVRDLGSFWEEATGLPIPLGCIAIHRRVPADIKLRVEQLIGASLDYAWKNPEVPVPYMQRFARDMEPRIMKAHVQTFVNQYSRDLGEEGRAAINRLILKAKELNIIRTIPLHIYVGESAR